MKTKDLKKSVGSALLVSGFAVCPALAVESKEKKSYDITINTNLEEAQLLKDEARFLLLQRKFDIALEELKSQQASVFNTVFGNEGLVSLSSKQGVELSRFYGAVQKFHTESAKLNFVLAAAKAKVRGIDATEEFQSAISSRMSQIEASLVDAQNEFNAIASGLHFNILLPNKKLHIQKGIDITGINPSNFYNSDDIARLRRDEQKLRAERYEERRAVTDYNRFHVNKVNTFILQFGRGQSYFQANPKLLEDAVLEVQEAFWSRSYLRATFGMKIGSFGVAFEKPSFFSLKNLFAQTDVDILQTHYLTDENALLAMQDRALTALGTVKRRSDGTIDIQSFLNGSMIATAVTMFRGKSPLAAAQKEIMKLIIADIEEERTLGKAGGLKKMRELYRSRYYSDKNLEGYYKDLQKKYLSGDVVADAEDFEADVKVAETDTMFGHFNLVVTALEKREDRLEEADGIALMIAEITKNNEVKRKRQRRLDI